MKNSLGILTILAVLACSYAIPLVATQNQIRQESHMENYRLIQKPSIVIMGIELRTSNAPEEGPQDIPKHWEKFYSENITHQIPNRVSDEVMALYCDYEGDHTKSYSLVIGCPVSFVDEIPEGLVVKTLPATSYAVFSAVGEHPKSLIETWGNIWQTSLDRTYTGDYEIYGEKFTENSPQEVEVYIAIQNRLSRT